MGVKGGNGIVLFFSTFELMNGSTLPMATSTFLPTHWPECLVFSSSLRTQSSFLARKTDDVVFPVYVLGAQRRRVSLSECNKKAPPLGGARERTGRVSGRFP